MKTITISASLEVGDIVQLNDRRSWFQRVIIDRLLGRRPLFKFMVIAQYDRYTYGVIHCARVHEGYPPCETQCEYCKREEEMS